MNKNLTILITGLSLMACLSLHGQSPFRLAPPPIVTTHMSVMDALTRAQLTDASGKRKAAREYLRGKKLIGIYFSAHWCGPCRAFTPELVKFRRHCNQNDIPFEVVFVSFDKSEKDMYHYMRDMKMKWPAVPFNSKLAKQLKRQLNVGGIPALIIIDSRGEIVSSSGRSDVLNHGRDSYNRWMKISLERQRFAPPPHHHHLPGPPPHHLPGPPPPHHQPGPPPPHHLPGPPPPHHQPGPPPHHQPGGKPQPEARPPQQPVPPQGKPQRPPKPRGGMSGRTRNTH